MESIGLEERLDRVWEERDLEENGRISEDEQE